MQDAAKISIGQQARTGNDAADIPDFRGDPNSEIPAPTPTPPPAGAAGANTVAQAALEKLCPTPRDLAALSCGCRNHRQLKRWIDSYLKQNPLDDKAQRNAGMLRGILAEITRWSAPARLRLASLEVLRPVVTDHCGELAQSKAIQTKAAQGPASIASPQEQRRDLLTATILYQHLAQAYTSICVQLASTPHPLFYRRRLARALHRGIDSYRRQIQISSRFYLAPPKGSWVALHRLLQLAREQRLDQRRVIDPCLSANDKSGRFQRRETVAHPYSHVALFASANPLQLTPEEQASLWQRCARWAKAAKLQNRPGPGTKSLLASLKLDQPPIPASRLQQSRVDMQYFSTPQGWAIDLGGPLQQLQQQLQRHLRRADVGSADMLKRVQELWAGKTGRGGQRTPVNVPCQVVVGISAICHHLQREDKATPELEHAFKATSPQGSDMVMAVNSIEYRTGRPLNDYEVALPSAPSVVRHNETTATQKRYQPVSATLLNSSSRGAGLRLPAETQGRLHIGDLVAIQVRERWEVALVRWQYGLPDQCRAGVELLGGHTSAVRVHRHTQSGGRTAPMAGLLTGGSGHPSELILPTPLFQTGDKVDIVSAGQVRTVTLHQQNLVTGSCAIFEFS
ncbi:hypothetical protein PVT68_12900 [Microbulbifer bruguierae]|uniref:GTPase n=1 Tax=Microbulbifer bruguierae TaxID=3029061 RepID=A0ABY8NB41_9GAMM|nr:hypothetical protein [Microbulbifer bruguierae]WGL15665.1 hypothetical protein PVT68_12900 [Microbulbifer bruguierae]